MRLSAARSAPPARDYHRVPFVPSAPGHTGHEWLAGLACGLGAWTGVQVRHAALEIYQFEENAPIVKERREGRATFPELIQGTGPADADFNEASGRDCDDWRRDRSDG